MKGNLESLMKKTCIVAAGSIQEYFVYLTDSSKSSKRSNLRQSKEARDLLYAGEMHATRRLGNSSLAKVFRNVTTSLVRDDKYKKKHVINDPSQESGKKQTFTEALSSQSSYRITKLIILKRL